MPTISENSQTSLPVPAVKAQFQGSEGARLAARLDLPLGKYRAFAIIAHCFTCSKDLKAIRSIAGELALLGIGVLRFDFTGLGSSEGEFSSTNFSSNVDDIVCAADWLAREYEAPAILIGHSLGGAAVLAAASRIDSVRAVVTINAPADAEHVTRHFAAELDRIRRDGAAKVTLGGRQFTIRKQFLEDIEQARVSERLKHLKQALLVMHAPRDEVVGIDNATQIYTAARHPKSFVSLDGADHLLTGERDAIFAARVIAAWVERYLPPAEPEDESAAAEGVVVRETGNGKFQNEVQAGGHHLLADEPVSFGGLDSGPSPYEFLSIGLAACTSMTLRIYASRKKMDLGPLTVSVSHKRIHARDCEDCSEEQKSGGGYITRFTREIDVEGDIADDVRDKLLEIADKCPVHRTLITGATISTAFTGQGENE
jgi:uncharacterized OsmC-like protein/alpha-beta hydrolase superfamily lysophospholipase